MQEEGHGLEYVPIYMCTHYIIHVYMYASIISARNELLPHLQVPQW